MVLYGVFHTKFLRWLGDFVQICSSRWRPCLSAPGKPWLGNLYNTANVYNNKPQQQTMHLVGVPHQMTQIAQQKSHSCGSVTCTKGKGKAFHWIYLDYMKNFACVRWSFGWCYNDSCVRLSEARTKKNEEAMPMAKYHGRKEWLSLTTVGSTTIRWVLYTAVYRNLDHFNQYVIGNVYRTVGISLYWELTHWANPDYRTLG